MGFLIVQGTNIDNFGSFAMRAMDPDFVFSDGVMTVVHIFISCERFLTKTNCASSLTQAQPGDEVLLY